MIKAAKSCKELSEARSAATEIKVKLRVLFSAVAFFKVERVFICFYLSI